MQRYEVRTVEQALAYITDCNLATVEHMAMLKSKSKSEFQRQINICQIACNWMVQMKVDYSSTRAEDIIGKCTVEEWANKNT